MRRKGVTLVLVLISLSLAAALILPLATLSGVSAVSSVRTGNSLRHRLASESVVALLPELLAADRELERQLDRTNRATWAFDLDQMHVEVLLQDDTAKLPLAVLGEARTRHVYSTALRRLQSRLNLPELTPLDEPHSTACLDDLFAEPHDPALFGNTAAPHAWSAYITTMGSEVHVFRADAAILEALLADIEPGLGDRLERARRTAGERTVERLITTLDLPAPKLQAVQRRLTDKTQRYSLLVRTALGDDVRQQYVICSAEAQPVVLVHWEVAP